MPKVVISEIGFNGNFDNINKGNKIVACCNIVATYRNPTFWFYEGEKLN